jgi:hypothetical protein
MVSAHGVRIPHRLLTAHSHMIIAHGPWYTEWHHVLGLIGGIGATFTGIWTWIKTRR